MFYKSGIERAEKKLISKSQRIKAEQRRMYQGKLVTKFNEKKIY